MSDLIRALAAENPGAFAPAPDQSDPGVVDQGGVQVFEKGAAPPTPGGGAPTDAAAALVSALSQVMKPQKQTVELGDTVPMIDGSGNPMSSQPQQEPQPQQAQPEQPYQQPQAPTPDMVALAQQYAQAQQRIQQAEAAAQDAMGWREQNEPLLQAVRQKWPEIQGLQAKNAELVAKAEYEAQKAQYISDSFQNGQAPDIGSFEKQWRLNQTLEAASNIKQTVADAIAQTFDQRDAAFQQQQAQQQQQNYVQQVQQHFVGAWEQLQAASPTLKGREGIRRAVWAEWSANPQVPVAQVAAQYVRDLQMQSVAQQAPQMTRAEVAASVPRTVVGGSGAAAKPVSAHPAGWAQMGLQDRIAYNRSRQ